MLIFFDQVWTYNIVSTFIIFYILSLVLLGSHFASCDLLDRPLLLNSFNVYSIFFIVSLYLLFGFDFTLYDQLYFFNQCLQVLFLFFSINVLAISRDYFKVKNIIKYEYDFLFLFVMLSALCLCFSHDLLLIYLAIELQSLTLYIFASFNRHSNFSTEAGIKYFIFGGVMSCFLLLGLSLTYIYLGSLSFETIANVVTFSNDSLHFVGFLFILIVFLFKVGAVPFHYWLADVYEGAILTVTMLMSTSPKIILFGVILKLSFFILFDFTDIWSVIFNMAAIFSIIIGSLSAIYQKRLKRLFAYSTIVHTGFILLALVPSSLYSANSLIFYIIVYSILSVSLFGLLINMSIATHVQPKYIINLSSIGSNNYIFSITFTLILLAIAGIPPLVGFFSKFLILLSLIGSKYYFSSLIVIFFSSIACFYYIRLIKVMFFVDQSKNTLWLTNKTMSISELIIGSFLFIIICYFVWPNVITSFTMITVLSLL